MADNQEPIVVKRVKKVVGGHGGGVWKIAYADFVTAMMAFFLLMWVLGSTTSGDLAGISAYFQNPLRLTLEGGQGSGDTNSIIKGGGPQIFRTDGVEARADADTEQRRVSEAVEFDERARKNVRKMLDAKEGIEQEIKSDPELAKIKNQVFMDINASGLRIQIVDEKNRAMFGVGGADMAGFASRLLRAIGGVLKDMPNGVRIEGHTDSLKYSNGQAGYSNWELSTDRANAARRELIAGGLPEQRVSQVVGFADTIRLNPDNPNDPLNRRISITVLDQDTGATKGGLDRRNAPPGPGQNQPAATAPQGSVAVPAGEPTASGRVPILVLPSRPSLGPSSGPPSGSGNR